jgi:Anti-sigma factor NepR
MPKNRETRSKSGRNVNNKPERSMIIVDPLQASLPVHDLIGEKLRAYYDHVASEPVPDRFAALLEELEAKSSPKKPR